jgi:NADH dehydrogenase [ubiquinone] 1 alpha subcomplex assembly factor 6
MFSWSLQRRLFSSLNHSTSGSAEYCLNLVKNHDFENYLIGLLVPRRDRHHFYSIHAFNVEMALIKSSTADNKNAARLRCKWWMDFLSQVYDGSGEGGGSYQHPVSQSLAEAIQERSLSRRWLEHIVESRLQEILSPQVETLSDLEDLVEKSHSSLLYLTLEAVNPKQDYPQEIDSMASHVGVSFGLVTILRGTAYDISQVGGSHSPFLSSHHFHLLPLATAGTVEVSKRDDVGKGIASLLCEDIGKVDV